MNAERPLARIARAAARTPLLTLALLAGLALAGGLLALSLQPSVADDTLVPSSSASYRATQLDYREFGGDAVVVLVREPVAELISTQDLERLSALEACLAGQVLVPDEQLQTLAPAPAGALGAYGGRDSPCGEIMRRRLVQVVYGPGTFLNHAVAAVNTELLGLRSADQAAVTRAARRAYALALAEHLSGTLASSAAIAAGELEGERLQAQLQQLAQRLGISSLPSIEDTAFISQIVFAAGRRGEQPRARLHYLFPTADAALIAVRLRAGLNPAQVRRAIDLIRGAVAMKRFRLAHGAGYTVTGEPVVLSELASQITASIGPLLAGAIVVMALVLALGFGGAAALAPLAVALAAAAITFGIAALAGATLTMASVAVLPIVIGLAVDYTIQLQSRARESARCGRAAVLDAARRGGPALTTAALATAAGFVVLLLSPVPMVQGFGVLLVLGVVVGLSCTLTGGAAAVALADSDLGPLGASMRGAGEILRGAGGSILRGAGGSLRGAGGSILRGAGEILRGAGGSILRGAGGSLRGARDIVLRAGTRARAHARPRRCPPRVRGSAGATLAARAARRPGRVLAVGLLLAIAGWLADARTPVQSDISKLVPANTVALRDLQALQRVSGSSGEIDVIVHGADVSTPATIVWMGGYEAALLRHYGYSSAGGCAAATLCPGLSLPDLFADAASGARAPSPSSIAAQLAAVPRYFSQAVITADHGYAVLSFGIRLMPLSEQQRVIGYLDATLHPPAGVSAQLAGLPVLAAQANASLSSSSRRLLSMLAALLAVALVLALVLRRPARAIVPLVPIVLASGWSSLVVFVVGIPLNPLSATLGALVIAISTEFSVLLSERYAQELASGLTATAALARCYERTGAAVLASGVTALAGFGVLMLSNITMLRDFGFVTVIDLSVSLCGVLVLLPAVLAVAAPGGLRELLGQRAFGGRAALRGRAEPAERETSAA